MWASPEEGGFSSAHSPPAPLPSEFGNTMGVGGHAGGGSPKAQSIIACASVYPSGIHLPTPCSKAKEIGRFIPDAGEGGRGIEGTEKCAGNEIGRRPRSSSLLPFPRPPAFPFTLQSVVLPSPPPLPASLKHSGIRGCCRKYRGGEKAERKDRNTDPLGLSGGGGQ